MTTQTLQKPQEFTDEGVHPLVEAPMLVEAVEVAEETQSAPTVEIVTRAPVPTRKDAMLLRMARAILRFDDWVGGPPMTKRERLNLYVESTAVSTRIGPFV